MTIESEKVIDQDGNVVGGESTQIAEFVKTEAALASMREALKNPPDFATKEGYEEGRVAIRELVTLRTSLDKARLALNKDDQDRIKFRNTEAKRILAVLSPMEEKLVAAKKEVDGKIERQKEEARRKEEARVEQHTEAMNIITVCGNVNPTMESGAIKEKLDEAKQASVGHDFEEFSDAADAERKRVITYIEKTLVDRMDFEDQQAEQTRIAKEQAEKAAELQAEQDRINKENEERQRKLDEQQAEIDRQKAEAEAEEKRKADEAAAEEERKAAEAKAEEERKAQEEEERKRLAEEEESRVDREAVINWANKLRFIDGPDGITNENCKATVSAALITLDTLANHVVRKMGGE